MLEILKIYKPRKNSKYYKLKDDLLINAQNFYDERKIIIEAFKNKIFPLSNPDYYPEYVSKDDTSSRSSSPKGAAATSRRSSSDLSASSSPRSSSDLSTSTSPTNESKNIDSKIIRHYFGFDSLKKILEFLNRDLNNKDLNVMIVNKGLPGLKWILMIPEKENKTSN